MIRSISFSSLSVGHVIQYVNTTIEGEMSLHSSCSVSDVSTSLWSVFSALIIDREYEVEEVISNNWPVRVN